MEDHHHQDFDFKTPLDQFNQELDGLEKYNTNDSAISRISLYKQFDPLVGFPKSPVQVQLDAATRETPETIMPEETVFNESSTLIHINTPASKRNVENHNSLPGDFEPANGHFNLGDVLDASTITQEAESEKHQAYLTELSLLNEQLADLYGEQLRSFPHQLLNSQKEEERLITENNSLRDELNKVEKNYFDTHTRYENMRSVVKEMDIRDAVNKDKLLEINENLKEKELECRKWKKIAEESVQT